MQNYKINADKTPDTTPIIVNATRIALFFGHPKLSAMK